MEALEAALESCRQENDKVKERLQAGWGAYATLQTQCRTLQMEHDAALAKGEADKVKAAADKKKRLEAAKYAKAEAAYTGSQHAAKVMNANFG